MKKELQWVDAVKGLCMISVYIYHLEAYYGYPQHYIGYFLRPFYVNAFFFVSGYLFFLKEKEYQSSMNKTVLTKKRLQNILFRLILPTIIFSTILFVPKSVFHSNTTSIKEYFLHIWGGIYYWFTSAMVVSQIILVFLVSYKKISFRITVIISILLFIIGLLINYRSQGDAMNYLPWYWKTGLVYTFIMVLGGIYLKYEKRIDTIIGRFWYLLVGSYFILLILGRHYDIPFISLGMSGVCNFYGFIILIIGISFIILLSKTIKAPSLIRFIGKQSIAFYFFSGVIPALLCSITKHIISEQYFIIFILVTILAVFLGFLIAWVVNKYLPFLVDLRKIKRQ